MHFAVAEHAKRFHRWTLYFDNLERGEKLLQLYFRKDWKDPKDQSQKEEHFKGWSQQEISRWMKLSTGGLP